MTKTNKKPVIVIFIRYYLPGFKSGGPVRSIANLIDGLSKYFQFKVITSDRDFLDHEKYPDIVQGWNKIGGIEIYYLPPAEQTWSKIQSLIRSISPQLIYLNSFFDPKFSIPILLLSRISSNFNFPILLAPRGEFSEAAIALKGWKKYPYVWLVKYIFSTRNFAFHATSVIEKQQIKKTFRNGPPIFLTENIVKFDIPEDLNGYRKRSSSLKCLKIVFISRIHPKKNLDFVLRTVKACNIPLSLSIFGPIDDPLYWEKCQTLIGELSKNVIVEYGGPVPHDQVAHKLTNADLFFLPTKGENFGHVIFESMLAGCLVLLSDKTPWQDLDKHGVGWSLPLECPEAFVEVIQKVDRWPEQKWQLHQKHLKKYIALHGNPEKSIQGHAAMFEKVMNESSPN